MRIGLWYLPCQVIIFALTNHHNTCSLYENQIITFAPNLVFSPHAPTLFGVICFPKKIVSQWQLCQMFVKTIATKITKKVVVRLWWKDFIFSNSPCFVSAFLIIGLEMLCSWYLAKLPLADNFPGKTYYIKRAVACGEFTESDANPIGKPSLNPPQKKNFVKKES